MVGRRTLLLAGGAAVLAAGCGKDEATRPAPSASTVLLRSLAAERALAASFDEVGMRRLAARARRRATRLAAAVSAAGGRPHDAPAPPGGGGRQEALRRGRAVLGAHVTALPSLTGRAARALGADVLAGAAGDVALLDRALAAPPDDPFPGTPR